MRLLRGVGAAGCVSSQTATSLLRGISLWGSGTRPQPGARSWGVAASFFHGPGGCRELRLGDRLWQRVRCGWTLPPGVVPPGVQAISSTAAGADFFAPVWLRFGMLSMLRPEDALAIMHLDDAGPAGMPLCCGEANLRARLLVHAADMNFFALCLCVCSRDDGDDDGWPCAAVLCPLRAAVLCQR
ncbi:hypothetical protein TcYC6_0000790 [Trypanosoma cruzi]|nr:hypothetical protein TcYC6_0000790 [Trypanosoma cruzi]